MVGTPLTKTNAFEGIADILGRFLESKMESPNHFWLMIWVFFFDVAFCIDFYLFSDGSKPWKLSSRLGGSTIFTKSTFSKIVGKIADLGCILGSQIDAKTIKTCIQEHIFFSIEFSWFLFNFGSILGGRDGPTWSLHTPYNSLQTLIFRMWGGIRAQESYQVQF